MTDTDTGDTEIAAGQYDMGDFLMDEGLDSFLAMMNRPGGLAFAPDDPVDLYVSDTYNHCIRRVDLATMSIWSFAGDCTEQGVLNYPGSLAITDAGTMYILDAGGTILRSLDLATGTVFADIFAPLSAGANAGIAFAQQASCILVADANHRAVRIFNLTDPSKNAIITTGSFAPIDIGYDPPTGKLYVSSSQYVWIYSLQSKALLSTYIGGESAHVNHIIFQPLFNAYGRDRPCELLTSDTCAGTSSTCTTLPASPPTCMLFQPTLGRFGFYPSSSGGAVKEMLYITSASYAHLLTVVDQCGSGTYDANFGLLHTPPSCISCQPGKFYSGILSVAQCTTCDLGKVSLNSGASACGVCPNLGTIPNSTRNGCDPCPINTYASTLGQLNCTGCSAATYTPSTGSSACSTCPAGTYSASAGAGCLNCPVGKYGDTPGRTACLDCPAGSYVPAPASNAATGWPNATCLLCPRGMHQPAQGSGTCLFCPAGLYQANLGASQTCTGRCPIGSFSTTVGATSARVCRPCFAGTFAMTSGSSVCTNCSIGTSSRLRAQTSCTTCAPGEVLIIVMLLVCSSIYML